MKAWMVEVYGYVPERFEAETKSKARFAAFRALREAVGRGMTFHDFLARGVSVTEVVP